MEYDHLSLQNLEKLKFVLPQTDLEPGMVVSMEPMIMIPEGKAGSGGYREHDILLVTENGAENLTGFPFGPEHNIIQK